MGRVLRAGAVAALLGLSACGPIPVADAEDQCFERARLTVQPRGEIGIGAGTGKGAIVNGEVNITSDYLQGRDPSEVYDSCVYQKSGQFPTRPLYSRADWKG